MDGGDLTYREEVERALNQDSTWRGTIWRLSREVPKQKDIAEQSGYSPGYISHCLEYLDAMVGDGTLPNICTERKAQRCRSALRAFVKDHQDHLSPTTVVELEKRANLCERRERVLTEGE